MPELPDSTRRLLLRRRIVRWLLGSAAAALAVLSVLDHVGMFGYRGDDWEKFDRRSCQVCGVIDGDTVQVRGTDRPTPVRLLGVIAPQDEHWARAAADFLRGRVMDKSVIVRLGPAQTRDSAGELLAYLYLGDGDDLNFDLIHDGLGSVEPGVSHILQNQFALAESEVRHKGRGMWASRPAAGPGKN